MHVELVELLRCVQPHEDTWLVAAVDALEDREIVRGTLGCPICHAEYPVRDRVVYFAPAEQRGRATEPDAEEAMRIAAALDLTDPRAIAVLHGEWGAHARLVRSLSPTPLIVLDPTGVVEAGDGVNVIVAGRAPLAARSVNAAAIGAGASTDVVASLIAAVRSEGRVLAPATLSQPPGVTELARDDDVWVAERQRDDIVSLRTRRFKGSDPLKMGFQGL